MLKNTNLKKAGKENMKKRSSMEYIWENFNGQENDLCEQTASQEKQINGNKWCKII